MDFLPKIEKLRYSEINKVVNSKLKEFENNKNWFSELCFCILTANSKAETAINIQNEIGEDFDKLSFEEIRDCIIKNKHRFHNNKAKYIVETRKFKNIKEDLENFDEFEKREFLVKNVKGIGYKEASHFLRNVGYKNLAILDRHILALMNEEKPLNKNNYLEIEKKFNKIAKKLNMNSAELDLYMWYIKTGNILK